MTEGLRSNYLGLPVVSNLLDINSRKVLKVHIFTLNLVYLGRLLAKILEMFNWHHPIF